MKKDKCIDLICNDTFNNLCHIVMCMTEPLFEVYHKDREEVPSVDESVNEGVTIPDDLTPDKTIRGYQNLTEFLDNHREVESVSHPEWGDTETKIGQYRWKEVGVESAPEVEICSTCGATVQTNSDERAEELAQIHHISTGH